MPVWHKNAQSLRDSEELHFIGITQEQHPDRCLLYAQWQEFDWPILWDPFNLTGSKAVPVILGVDPSGLIRAQRLHPGRIEKEPFFSTDYGSLAELPLQDVAVTRALLSEPLPTNPRDPAARAAALAAFLWQATERWDAALDILRARADQPAASGSDHFELGVALRMRYDADRGQAGDLQGSIDAWGSALAADPSQYIWRRRIQQYGPRLDKPYPFYGWVAQAEAQLLARGEQPTALLAMLTGSEVAGNSDKLPARIQTKLAPDPERAIPLDKRGCVAIEGAAALHTAASTRRRVSSVARVHLALRPNKKRAVHWSNDAGPTLLWISLPEGWVIGQSHYELDVPAQVSSSEVRRLDFEIMPPKGHTGGGMLSGYALYYICEGESGECTYLRQDFQVRIPAAR